MPTTTPELPVALLHQQNFANAPDLEQTLAQLDLIDPTARMIVESSLRVVALRALEFSILTDPVILDLCLNNRMFLGADQAVLGTRLAELLPGQDVPDELFEHVLAQVRSGVAGSSTKSQIDIYFTDVVRDYPRDLTGGALRCVNCGYHFTAADLGEARRDAVLDSGLTLSEQKLSRRLRDFWKPPKYTRCTLDHVIPEAGLGAATVSNLQVLCDFCNHQKQIYRWPQETVARGVAASLLSLGGNDRGQWAAQAAAYVAIAKARLCGSCGDQWNKTELTATTRSSDRLGSPVTPWAMVCVCYDCYDPSA